MGTAQHQGRSISVVVADDEAHVVEYLCTVLHLAGMDVAATAATADEAVQAVHRLRPDVALIDLRMPGGGLEAVRLIGSLSPDTRIVVFSSEADEPDVLRLLHAGIDGYVVKGCSPDQLTGAITSAMAGETFLAPAVNRVAVQHLAARLRAEERESLQRTRLRARIGAAMAADGHRMVYQPCVDLETGEVRGVEALVRFTGKPLRPPDAWFADADQAELRVPLEMTLAARALRQLPALRADLALAVNVSPRTVLSGRLAEVLTGASLPRLTLEVTEHMPVADYAAFTAALIPWRRAGMRLAVDDAGAGYASFAHILNLSPDVIKLDISLTHEIHHDRRRQSLARALIGFAKEMGVVVVAEGIESAEQLEVVTGLGARLAQGFHLGRPRPLEEQPELCATDPLTRGPSSPSTHELDVRLADRVSPRRDR